MPSTGDDPDLIILGQLESADGKLSMRRFSLRFII